MPRSFLTTADWSQAELQALLDDARALKAEPRQSRLTGKTAAFVFFNPSLRTRTSFQVGFAQLGGTPVVLDAGGTWPLEFAEGAVMDGDAEEHAKEAARVLSAYVDLIGIRAFPKFQDWQAEREDPLLSAFVAHATVPIVNMETIVHPCQELAMLMALQDAHGEFARKKITLTWTYHPKPLNTAVMNSGLLATTKMGMDVTLLVPSEAYLLDPMFMEQGQRFAKENGSTLTVTTDVEAAYDGADAVYAKSWGRLDQIGLPMEERLTPPEFKRFIVDEAKMALTNDATFSHCLPMRRNVKVTDAVADSPRSLIIEEAENRLHVQKAVMSKLLGAL
ncbi:N-acetylornithine carbamoyltransferase [Parvularcula dongshanensis]|uniref:N-acetylornithine carbamoyltransferase n=1 Tax=Parvularcula dongshanensis TaxID=1173995 RepID=A0A840I2F3_9PROT|nr:N-acetylornithine carbamoyltransferase [Parvularcula dongshanensis]MBB4658414.1 N-acetylornithine carbamoyltransferase [Parvularcula dongshanensis]